MIPTIVISIRFPTGSVCIIFLSRLRVVKIKFNIFPRNETTYSMFSDPGFCNMENHTHIRVWRKRNFSVGELEGPLFSVHWQWVARIRFKKCQGVSDPRPPCRDLAWYGGS